MSSLVSHIFIPLAILFIFSEKLEIDKRYIVILCLFGILPDTDIFLFHRATFHNIFFLAIPILVLMFSKENRNISGIISFYIGSHLLLDIFDGGIFLLYPLYHDVFFIHSEFWFNNGSIHGLEKGFVPILNYGMSNHVVNIVNSWAGEPMISSENMGILVLLAIFLVICMIKRKDL